jgi:hypothetical protein
VNINKKICRLGTFSRSFCPILQDLQPLYLTEGAKETKEETHSRNSGYIRRDPSSTGPLPSSERYRPPSLPFSRYKERTSGAVDPAMLLLTEKPFDYIRNNALDASFDNYQPIGPLPNQISFQEGAAALDDEETGYNQGSLPAEGSVDAPKTRPERPRPLAAGPNRYRAPVYRPRRPGATAASDQNSQTESGQSEGNNWARPSPLLSDEVVLPPVDPNNPNFAPVVRNSNPNSVGRQPTREQQPRPAQYPYDPYFPPNYPGAFPNQYPGGYAPPYQYQAPAAPASSSSSTSTNGNGAAASASSTGKNFTMVIM